MCRYLYPEGQGFTVHLINLPSALPRWQKRRLFYPFVLQHGADLLYHLLRIRGALHHVMRRLAIQRFTRCQHLKHFFRDQLTGQRWPLCVLWVGF